MSLDTLSFGPLKRIYTKFLCIWQHASPYLALCSPDLTSKAPCHIKNLKSHLTLPSISPWSCQLQRQAHTSTLSLCTTVKGRPPCTAISTITSELWSLNEVDLQNQICSYLGQIPTYSAKGRLANATNASTDLTSFSSPSTPTSTTTMS